MKENITAKGSVELFIIDAKTNELIDHYNDFNKIVNGGITNVAKLIGGAAVGKPISKVGFGEGTSTPAGTDSSLTNQFLKNIDSVNYPTGNQVQFVFTLNADEGNGMNITELGLLNVDDVLFSRKVRSAIVKTNAVIITGIWTITVN